MAVWTPVSLEQVNAWLAGRGLEAAGAISPVEEGVEDSVFRVEGTQGEVFCLRLYERTEAEGPLGLALLMAEVGLPSCPPLADAQGDVLTELNGKPAALFPWIEGISQDVPSLYQIEQVGTFLGRMAHEGMEHCGEWQRSNPRDWDWFEETAQRISPVLDPQLRFLIEDEVALQRAYWAGKRDVLYGPVHADLFRNNVMFKPDGTLAAVLDWGFCASNCPLIYDLAITANDWCLKEGGLDIDPASLTALLMGYSRSRPLSPAEEAAWPMALRWAALRFALSRLHDHHFTRVENGKALDPEHFVEMLKLRCGAGRT